MQGTEQKVKNAVIMIYPLPSFWTPQKETEFESNQAFSSNYQFTENTGDRGT